MDKEEKEELLNALEVINRFCKTLTNCSSCPLREDDGYLGNCYLENRIPEEWKVNRKEETDEVCWYD